MFHFQLEMQEPCLKVAHTFLHLNKKASLVQFSSVAQSCPTLCDPMDRSTPGLPAHHQLRKLTQAYVH